MAEIAIQPAMVAIGTDIPNWTVSIDELACEESRALLAFLYNHLKSPEFQVRCMGLSATSPSGTIARSSTTRLRIMRSGG